MGSAVLQIYCRVRSERVLKARLISDSVMTKIWRLTFLTNPYTSSHCTYVRYSLSLSCRHKTAELSQRRPRDAPNTWVPWKVLRVLTTHLATFPKICNGLSFRSILTMCVQNLKFVALPVPEIIGDTQKIWAVPGNAHAPFSPKILKGFCSNGPCEYTCQIWSWQLYPFLR